MTSFWPNADDPALRQAHIDFCMGCQLINETRGTRERWILCFEYADRSGYAVRELIGLYDLSHKEMRNHPNHGLPRNAKDVVTLKALVDDITSRFEKGTLVTGEARAK